MNQPPVSPKAEPAEGQHPEPAKVIIVVARGENSLYRYTLATFESEPAVEVVLDRRYEERRRHATVPSVERRQRDRRSIRRVDLLKAQGWLIIRGQPSSASH